MRQSQYGTPHRAGPRRKRVLFVLRHRDNRFTDECYSYGTFTSGLFNSAKLVADMLRELGHEVRLAEVCDSNAIDKEVFRWRPDIVIIEAYFVPPDKFKVLHRLHPRVKWVVRNHSAMPFLAQEGIVIEWSLKYLDHPNVFLACNDERTFREFRNLARLRCPKDSAYMASRVVYLPNYYPATLTESPRQPTPVLDVGCFGAVRPLKNQLIQAVAAIEYAAVKRRPLRFHINATRLEQNAGPILKNLRALFDLIPNAVLVEHRWLKRPQFLSLCGTMDIGLHVSLSETFSIGTADLLTHGVPVVTSPEVPFVDPSYYANPTHSASIVRLMDRALRAPRLNVKRNLKGLARYSDHSRLTWSLFVGT